MLELDLVLAELAREGREESLLRAEVLFIFLEVVIQVFFLLCQK